MSTYVLIHGGGDVGWSWHLVAAELRNRGHEVVAPDLPGDDASATFADYPAAVVEAVGDRTDLVVVGHSFGGFTAPLVADRLAAGLPVLVAGMIPAPGESPGDWGENTGCGEAVRAHPSPTAMREPWPLGAWPAVPTRFVLCREDRCFPPDFFRRLAAERLGIVPDEITAGHCVALSRPAALADLLESHR
jgi:pimeloyl-ACP methyl ester carboxylesterase